jgi:phosphoglycolate phosphatase-like HAD superfamily hydrolase
MPLVAAAERPADWVGSWYSETSYDGKNHVDHMRQLRVFKVDGTLTDTRRLYAGSEVVSEIVARYQWGVENKVYWIVCRTTEVNGAAPRACDERFESEILSVDPRVIRYRRKDGSVVALQRVRHDFKLP